MDAVYKGHGRASWFSRITFGFNPQQRHPDGIDSPADMPIRMKLSQGSDGGQGMQYVAHRANPHDQHTAGSI